MSSIWHTFFFDPVYNILIGCINLVPGGDVGVAIILTTIVVKVVLLPFSLKAARTQLALREIEPQLKDVKERLKDKREEQAREMMDLYKKAGINPFASILLLFIQIPIIIALYLAVISGGGIALPQINTALLYAFIPAPEVVHMLFMGLIDITTRSLPLALLAGVTQYIHTNLSLPKQEPRDPNKTPDFKDDFARSMQLQMRYVMPVIIFIVAYTISAAVALYFTISNLTAIAQEYIVRRQKQKLIQE
ncbi:MAG: YidC/Oxa1 family membrane protein insertase [Candidatus Pacebacteria bacterium]|nr:YidC/Oxa1 family membrane protein insertase [Candidatus Paceibacterota bacterium]